MIDLWYKDAVIYELDVKTYQDGNGNGDGVGDFRGLLQRLPQINVAVQQRDPGSLVNWMERLTLVRKECPEFGRGALTLLESPAPGVLLHRCEWRRAAVLALHNLTDRPAAVGIDLKAEAGEHLTELLGDSRYERIDLPREIEMPGYGCRWFRLGGGRWQSA